MSFQATVTLRRGRYDASGPDDRFPEQIPSPFRLFCALVSAAGYEGDPAEDGGLQWLERQSPPTISCPPVLDVGRSDVFFVTNRIEPAGGSMSFPARKNNLKHRSWVSFDGDCFQFVWGSEPDDETFAALERLANKVTYLGRVESEARIVLTRGDSMLDAGNRVLHPVSLAESHYDVTVPYSGALQALCAAHERGGSSWEVARLGAYAPKPEAKVVSARGPFASLLIFKIDGQPVGGSNALDLAVALRAAVMSRVAALVGEDSLPGAVHGHDSQVGHLAYVSLPFAGHQHADGRVLGVGVALPRDLAGADRRSVERSLVGAGGLTELRYSRSPGGKLGLEYQPFGGPTTLQAERWLGAEMGSRTWTTVTPMMLDRFPHSADEVPQLVVDSVVASGYPRPSSARISPVSFLTGGIRYRHGWRQSLGRRPARPVWHVSLTFDEPLLGPVLIGSLRFLGGGLCLPAAPLGGQTRQERA